MTDSHFYAHEGASLDETENLTSFNVGATPNKKISCISIVIMN